MTEELFMASIRWMFSSPGIPKTYLTPSFSIHLTTRWATVITIALFEVHPSSLNTSLSFIRLDRFAHLLFPFISHFYNGSKKEDMTSR
ncbi:MAG: hypothetical protein ABJB76_04525 [Candidatus Nitrosocosmicus sp.]